MKSIPRFSSALAIFACVAAFISFTISASMLQAQTPAGPNRPANVPEGYLITPFGYFHPSCVVRLAEGDTRIAGGSAIQHRDGTKNTVPNCGYTHFTVKGEALAPGATKPNAPTIGHSWIEAGNVTTGNSYGELTAIMTVVPPTPTSHDGQTLYFFPGLEDDADVVTIIQPVLGWNADSAAHGASPVGTAAPARTAAVSETFGKARQCASTQAIRLTALFDPPAAREL